MDGLCYRLFTGSVGTENHYRHIGRSNQPGKLFRLQNPGACTVKQHLLFPAHRSHWTEHIFRQLQQMLPVYRFGQVIPGSELDGAHHIRNGNIFRGQDERDVLPFLAQPFQKGNAVPLR